MSSAFSKLTQIAGVLLIELFDVIAGLLYFPLVAM